MPVTKEILLETLKASFKDGDISLNALTNDDDHWQVTIKSRVFNGKSRVEQHRMVTDAVKTLNIHALSIKTEVIL